MRIVEEFSVRGFKLTVFVHHEKYEVKLQNPSLEIIIKYREEQVPSRKKITDFLQSIPDDLWLDDLARFETMKQAFMLPPVEKYEDPEII